jgi:membrane protein implicated in regulation of membrane protease activity
MTPYFHAQVSQTGFVMLYLIAIGWMYVVVLMTVAEAMSARGSLLGAAVTFMLYGALPLAIVLYIFGAPMRRRVRQAALGSGVQPDGSGHAPADAVTPEREEP